MSDPNHKTLALEYLAMANTSYLEAKRKKAHFAHIARRHGVTIREIADAYEVAPGTIRYMLNNTDETGAETGLCGDVEPVEGEDA